MPQIPSGVSASCSNGSFIVNWYYTPPATGINFSISRSFNGGDWQLIAGRPSTPNGEQGWSEPAPAIIGTYAYRVNATDASGTSEWSAPSSVTNAQVPVPTQTGGFTLPVFTRSKKKGGKGGGGSTGGSGGGGGSIALPWTGTIVLSFADVPARQWGVLAAPFQRGAQFTLDEQQKILAGTIAELAFTKAKVSLTMPTSGPVTVVHFVEDAGAWDGLNNNSGVSYNNSIGAGGTPDAYVFRNGGEGSDPQDNCLIGLHEISRMAGCVEDDVTQGSITGNPTGYGIPGVFPAGSPAYWDSAARARLVQVFGVA